MSTATPDTEARHKRRTRDPFPEGSRAAYEQVTELHETAARVLSIIDDHGPLTHEQAHAEYMARGHAPKSPQRVATVISELRDLGLVEQSPIWGRSRLGNRSARWQGVTP